VPSRDHTRVAGLGTVALLNTAEEDACTGTEDFGDGGKAGEGGSVMRHVPAKVEDSLCDER
jgi:hypothetical protein